MNEKNQYFTQFGIDYLANFKYTQAQIPLEEINDQSMEKQVKPDEVFSTSSSLPQQYPPDPYAHVHSSDESDQHSDAIVDSMEQIHAHKLPKSLKNIRGRRIRNPGTKLKDFRSDLIKRMHKSYPQSSLQSKYLNEDVFLKQLSQFGLTILQSTLSEWITQDQTPKDITHKERDKVTAYHRMKLALLDFIQSTGEIPKKGQLKKLQKV